MSLYLQSPNDGRGDWLAMALGAQQSGISAQQASQYFALRQVAQACANPPTEKACANKDDRRTKILLLTT